MSSDLNRKELLDTLSNLADAIKEDSVALAEGINILKKASKVYRTFLSVQSSAALEVKKVEITEGAFKLKTFDWQSLYLKGQKDAE